MLFFLHHQRANVCCCNTSKEIYANTKSGIIWQSNVCHHRDEIFSMKSDTWSRHNASVHLCMCLCIIKPSGFCSLFVVFNIIKPVLFTTSSIDIFFFRGCNPPIFMYSLPLRSHNHPFGKAKWRWRKKTALLLIFYITLVSSSSLNTHSHTQFTVAHMRWFLPFFFRNRREGKRERESVDVMVINSLRFLINNLAEMWIYQILIIP